MFTDLAQSGKSPSTTINDYCYKRVFVNCPSYIIRVDLVLGYTRAVKLMQ